jgi:hypothetical protein
MDARQFIDLVGAGQSAEARDALEELLSSAAFEKLEAKKQEMASTIFTGKEEEPTEEPNVESQEEVNEE